MRKIGILAVLTLGCMLAFSTVAAAATTSVGPTTNPPTVTGTNGTSYLAPTTPVMKYDSPTNAKIHSAYSKTSDACASCHAVHTAVSNDGSLLQFADAQVACWACHDGTVAATYNVVTGTHDSTVPSSGGKFALAGTTNLTDPGFSNHGMAPGLAPAITTASAPGGAGGSAAATAGLDKNGAWNTTFECAACHDPHGTFGNARLLNPNVNGYSTTQYNVMLAATGKALTSTDQINYTTSVPFFDGYPYYKTTKVYVNGAIVTSGFKLDGANSKIIFTPALLSTDTVKAAYYPGLIVKMDIAAKLTPTEQVKHQTGMNQFCGACHTDYNNVGKTVSYNADGSIKATGQTGGAYKTALGEYQVAYRHSVGFGRTPAAADPLFTDANSLDASYPGLVFEKSNWKTAGTLLPTVNCITCHYAHGTDDAFITSNLAKQLGTVNVFNGNNATGSPIIQTYDTTRSGALKRLPNMGVCQGCHNKV